jgi:Asp-tRNA(Asn)/Glu-tRNA(Gln) amidotransferase A subunit family amidase
MEQTLTQPAAAAAAMIHNKKVSSRELTELVLGRVDTVNATLNAVVELVREAALQEAAAAD